LHFYAFFVTILLMRTTIEITDELLRQAKEKAAADGTALRQVVEVRSTKNFRL
jgi:Arc/MetJ family transcription regulator